MAQKLKSFDWSKQSALTVPSGKADYPWDPDPENNGDQGWFDGDIWRIEEDDDFDTPPLMMERVIRTRATGRKAKVQVRHRPSDNGVYRFSVTVNSDTLEDAEKVLAKKLGKDIKFKRSPFGVIVLQRTDIEGPDQVKARERREKSAATRAANKANGSTNGSKTKVTKKAPAKRAAPAKTTAKSPSKRAPRKLATV